MTLLSKLLSISGMAKSTFRVVSVIHFDNQENCISWFAIFTCQWTT